MLTSTCKFNGSQPQRRQHNQTAEVERFRKLTKVGRQRRSGALSNRVPLWSDWRSPVPRDARGGRKSTLEQDVCRLLVEGGGGGRDPVVVTLEGGSEGGTGGGVDGGGVCGGVPIEGVVKTVRTAERKELRFVDVMGHVDTMLK